MSEDLQNYVLSNCAKAVKMPLHEWLLKNELPSLVEPKLDGIRVFLFKSGEKLVISSKRGELYTPRSSPKVFAKLTEFVHAPHRAIFDGEYVSKSGLFLFDILQVDDRDLRPLSLSERKKILDEILEGSPVRVRWARARTEEQILAMKEREINKGGEGIIVKNPASYYGQANSWLKLKRFDTIDCFVVGYEETQEMKRSGVPRSWFIAVYDDHGARVDIGKVGSFVESVDPRKVTMGSVIEVRFQNVTDDLKLRAPFILRIRHDKTPEECLASQLSVS